MHNTLFLNICLLSFLYLIAGCATSAPEKDYVKNCLDAVEATLSAKRTLDEVLSASEKIPESEGLAALASAAEAGLAGNIEVERKAKSLLGLSLQDRCS